MPTYGIYVIMNTYKKEPHEIKELYKSHAEIESCFRIFKTDLDTDSSHIMYGQIIVSMD